MKELSAILRKKRSNRGSIDFDFPESKVFLDEMGRPVEIKAYEQNVATKIIEDFMLLANETVAKEYCEREIPFLYQFTLTGYGKDVEANLPNKKTEMIPVFQELAKKIGKEKVIWRYDPIFFSDRYTKEYHLKAFQSIAEALRGYTEKCVISFVDIYPKNKTNMNRLSSHEVKEDELRAFAKKLSRIAEENHMKIGSCAEKIDLDDCGIVHNCCIDRELIEKIIGCKLKVGKDKNQRMECGCVESVEIGTYNTCKNGCAYCYANYSSQSVETNAAKYDPLSPLLCGQVQENDKITVRKSGVIKRSTAEYF